MLLDVYLVPLLEIFISVLVPLVLTLKAVQVAQISKDHQYSVRILAFWLIYWFILFFLQMANINNHFRAGFTVFYLGQNHQVLHYLIKFYQLTLLPFTARTVLKSFNVVISEQELDSKVGHLLWRVCFDAGFFTNILSLFTETSSTSVAQSVTQSFISPITSHPKSTSNSRVPSNQASHLFEKDATKDQDYIPLEITKHRKHKTDQQGGSRKQSGNFGASTPVFASKSVSTSSINTRPSKDSLRSRNVSTESSSSLGAMEQVFGINLNHDPKKSASPKRQGITNNETLTSRNNLSDSSLPSGKRSLREGVRSVFS